MMWSIFEVFVRDAGYGLATLTNDYPRTHKKPQYFKMSYF